MKIAVTGAGGHAGTNLVRALAQDGEDVLAVDVTPPPDLPAGVEFAEGDVRDEDGLARCFEGAHRVYHLAAIISIDGDRDGRVWSVNVDGARSAARAARRAGVGRFVHFSSAHAFDTRGADVVDEERSRATGDAFAAYDRSKAAGEAAVREQVAEGLDAVILHPTGVIGAADPAPSRTGRVFLDAARGRLPVIVSGGFDWVNVKDVIAGARAAAELGQRGRSYILSGVHLDLAELIERAATRAGRPKPLLVLPPGLLRPFAVLPVLLGRLRGREALFTAESLATLGSAARFSHARAREELGYSPHPPHEAVDELIDWFLESGRVPARRAAIPGEWRTEFERQLRAFPLEGPAASRLLTPLLAEIARADAVVDASEQQMLDALATESGGGTELLAESERAQLLAALPAGQRESLLLLASVLAWVDEEQAAEERAALERLRDAMEIPRARAAELDDWGRDYIIDQNLDAAYADGAIDAAERKRVEELAGHLEITPFRLSRLDQRARKRNGLD